MQVGKWGNSPAVRLPAAVVEALQLKEGDEIEVAGNRKFQVARDRTKGEAIASPLSLARPMPPGWRFSRDEATSAEGEPAVPPHQRPAL